MTNLIEQLEAEKARLEATKVYRPDLIQGSLNQTRLALEAK